MWRGTYGLASIIISAATKEIAGFTVIGYLTEKAADIGTGKIWTELKKKIGDRPDSFECRLYGAIEKSVGSIFAKGLLKMYPLQFANIFLMRGAGKGI